MPRHGDWTARLSFLLLLVVLGGVAWLTRHPDAPIVERARDWPVIGPLAERFRAAYLGEDGASEASPPAGGVTVIYERREPRVTDARPTLWLRAGTPVRVAPQEEAAVVDRLSAIANVRWTERQGDWYRVERFAADPRDDLAGWVLVDDPEFSLPTLPATTEPPLPVAATAAADSLVAQARSQMDPAATIGRCGPYGLVTDAPSARLTALCAEVVPGIDRAYAQRYGRQPIGRPAETLFVFGRRTAFETFAGTRSRWRIEATGRSSGVDGYVAVTAEGREWDDLAATLVHEIAHLVNRRAVGLQLPPWLEEGLADDLADHLVGGKYEPAAWQMGMDRSGEDVVELRTFFDLGFRDFYGAGDYSHYAQALLAVRFLAGHPQLAGGFRALLADLAAGGTYSPETVAGHLGVDWPDLQASWDRWLSSNYREYQPFGADLAERP